MNTVTPQDWSAALRSGDYTQTTGRLKDAHGHCCIGVLADLLDPAAWNPRANPEGKGIQHWHDTEKHLPMSFAPKWFDQSHENLAAKLNDAHKWTFEQIADWIDDGMPVSIELGNNGVLTA